MRKILLASALLLTLSSCTTIAVPLDIGLCLSAFDCSFDISSEAIDFDKQLFTTPVPIDELEEFNYPYPLTPELGLCVSGTDCSMGGME